ncbi:MAG: hypothetical protein Faunusvirus20_10 [Faunusvirus sp.]|jgi:hypothetical protein|uniref:Uncharacterized protein n=1 Tax=Faunusvirus sp. TaxID=2487766 RepID=A0A3G4ZX89_9VIRU|nr:MAG: hypothetical protein Faunusvirus20_10 [Faunusvirus sp.]
MTAEVKNDKWSHESSKPGWNLLFCSTQDTTEMMIDMACTIINREFSHEFVTSLSQLLKKHTDVKKLRMCVEIRRCTIFDVGKMIDTISGYKQTNRLENVTVTISGYCTLVACMMMIGTASKGCKQSTQRCILEMDKLAVSEAGDIKILKAGIRQLEIHDEMCNNLLRACGIEKSIDELCGNGTVYTAEEMLTLGLIDKITNII